ncbi:uncharacterized protein B0H64DRAFT_363325 [Chaetomium fimeti]|uniref:TRP C-terminal domain-containing protein n=1 Tax=Chaetomium fimeti TaxID=1854472 RepID=A0AAE0HAT4_9PEZI|nr:hypothetical protein B0H64DRAFT_363325 [Chaetomium fimeti]
MARTIAALLAPSSIVAVLALIGTILPAATQAAHVQWIRCPDGSGGTQGFDDLWPTSTTARLLPDQDSAGASGFEFNVRADYAGEATCAELLQGDPPDMTISFDALTLSETYVVPPLNWTCVPFWDRPAVEQQHLKNRQPEIRLVAQHNLGKLGLLPAFSVQFIFFLGALTLRYPGFYQPVTSLLHWSALFSPIGPFGQEWRYDGVVDGIYEINGTLTGSYGLELMSQITGGPVTTDVWWNMVAIAAIITAVVAVLLLFHRVLSQHVPSLDWLAIDKDLGGEGPTSGSAFARGIWSVLRVILSYFLTPIVAISAYQLDNILLPAYHLALATLLIVLVIVGLTWMWKSAPSNQLGVLLLDPSKRYRRVSTDDSGSDTESERPAKARDLFAAIFFLLAFIRGITVGGLQFSPLAQVIILAATELSLLVTTAVLRPMRWQILAVFAGSGVARLMVVALTAVFLPELNASMSTRSRVGIAILVIHVAVLVFACTVPAGVRISSLISNTRAPADEPEIYGLSQLRRRSYALNDLSVPPLRAPVPARPYASARTNSPTCHHGHSPSDASSVFYHDRTSSPDALYLRAVPQHHYFRQPRSSSSTSRSRSHGSSRIAQGPPSSPRTSGSQWSSSQGGSSPTAVRSSSILTPAKAQRSETSNSEGTMEDTSEPPLITPHHGADYAFREADLYYGHGRPRRTGTFGPAAAAAVTPTPQSQPSAVRRVVSGMRDQLMGRRSASVERRGGHKGFEVRRPPRPPGL